MIQIERLCARYYISDTEVERLRPQVRELLTKHWHLIEAVAAALLRQRTLTAVEIDRTIPVSG
jgi:ATP-dependent Zn protease